MAELLKNIYNQKFFENFTNAFSEVVPGFTKEVFLDQIYDKDWGDKELKQRMRHIATALKTHLKGDYAEKINSIIGGIEMLQKYGAPKDSFEYMLFPDFIEQYGLDNYDTSINAFEVITQFTSCEFAVRPFIIMYPQKMIDQMLKWSKHKHPSVRRLASEGCRPRLPWAIAIPAFKENPSPILPILENLRNDNSESVRRSVANNLNDISKDNADIVINLVKKWQGESKETDWLIKHACRTLLKQGNQQVLELFGFGSIEEIKIKDLKILTPVVKVGGSLDFEFQLVNASKSISKIRLEYAIYYQKSNGSLSKKVFSISEKNYPNNSSSTIKRKQHFKVITTRKLYPGLHQLALIVNGYELEKNDFELVE
ncbi:MAG: DNA alkylation repair protein [Calditrichaeota bacterium]|nr:MAG: DNA alkylation repair protein [Calditrichota bacterium]MBL1206822.1 DNA alkylation repair protein [Calditrichota bacterium]NOG46649.1 DNA alkylation repair protein [Calditrichota bacterium]